MAINATKLRTEGNEDIFSYRDDFNDEQIIRFPVWWRMTEEEVEIYIENW